MRQLSLVPDAHPRRRLPLYTNSAGKTWRACPQLYKYRYVDLVRPLYPSAEVAFGLLMHAALEAWWRAAKDGLEAQAWLEAAMSAITATEEDPFRQARAMALMFGYHLRWQDMTWDGERLEVLAVEVEYRAELINPETGHPSRTWDRGGKIDVLVRGVDTGRVWIVEHKSTGQAFGEGSPYRDALVLDSQISHYMVGARALGYDPAGCIYDVLARPDQRPRRALAPEAVKWTKPTATKPSRPYAGQVLVDESANDFYMRICADIGDKWEDYYARIHVVRIGNEERRSALNDWHTGVMIQTATRLGMFPQNPDACGRFGSRCSFLDVCKGEASIDDESRFRKAERAHEELSEETVCVAHS